MRTLTISLILFLAISGACIAQESINYGSNNGSYITIDNTKLYYEEYGEGIPLMLFHGGLSSIKGFSNVIPELADHFKVIAVDAPGNGRSEQADSVSFQLMADSYSRMIDALELDSVYVYGYSLGGITALHLAADRPETVKMVVAHSVSNHLEGYNEGFAGTPEMTPEIIEEYAQWWLDGHLERTPQPGKWKKYIENLQDVWYPKQFISDDKLQHIQASLLILQGDRDLIEFDHAIYMYQMIKNSQLCILPGTSHFSLWENPDLVLDVITPYFLRKPKVEYELSY